MYSAIEHYVNMALYKCCILLLLLFGAICSSNFFLMVSPFARLCRLTVFFFSAGFSFLVVCLVCITHSRWSESSETDGIALTLQTRQ